MSLFRSATSTIALLSALALSGCGMMSSSSNVMLSAKLSGSSEVPAVASAGTGTLEATLNKDTNQLRWRVVHSGLSGPATAAHFHGPAAAGQNAGVVLAFKNAESPIEGEASLTSAQAADLLAGRWYVNVHTRANPAGEIRGQVVATP